MNPSVALTSELHAQAASHLLARRGQEDLCFATWYPSQGRDRLSALVHGLILPEPGDRRLHGNVSFTSEYFQRALGIAKSSGAGLAFMHSHLGPGWQGMSQDDVAAEERQAPATYGATALPLLGLTIGTDGALSGRVWHRTGARQYERHWCESVRVVGERLVATYHPTLMPEPLLRPELRRTVSAWGTTAQSQLARLRVGVVGTGSVGSIIAEALARMGIAHIRLIDFDAVEPVNLDRLLHSTRRDAALGRAKVDVLGAALCESATASPIRIDRLEWSVVEEAGFRAALDCDVLFSCVDRPWPRSILNLIAYAHLIPVIDGGLRLEARPGGQGLRRADWRVQVAAPTRRCLECLGQYDPGQVSAEREGYFDDPSYIAGLTDDHPIKNNENVFGFSLSVASFELLHFLAMIVAPAGVAHPGVEMYHFVTSSLERDPHRICNPNCFFSGLLAKGNRAGVTFTGRHRVAEEARRKRDALRPGWRYRLASYLSRLASRWLVYESSRQLPAQERLG